MTTQRVMPRKYFWHLILSQFGTDDPFPKSENTATLECEETLMQQLMNTALKMIWRDTRGQDLIEYALMAGFVAVAAGAIMPGVASSINVVFSEVNSIMVSAAAS